MSNTDNIPERAARRHRPAILAILVALVAAGVAIFVFGPMGKDADEPVREVAPASAESQSPVVVPVEPGTATPNTTAPANN